MNLPKFTSLSVLLNQEIEKNQEYSSIDKTLYYEAYNEIKQEFENYYNKQIQFFSDKVLNDIQIINTIKNLFNILNVWIDQNKEKISNIDLWTLLEFVKLVYQTKNKIDKIVESNIISSSNKTTENVREEVKNTSLPKIILNAKKQQLNQKINTKLVLYSINLQLDNFKIADPYKNDYYNNSEFYTKKYLELLEIETNKQNFKQLYNYPVEAENPKEESEEESESVGSQDISKISGKISKNLKIGII